MGVMLASFLWGFSEATLFFIVPDVLISFIAVRHFKRSLYSIIFTLVGALLGGSLIYFIGVHHEQELLTVIEKVPAISAERINGVKGDLVEQGVNAILLGPTKGTPYKIYAAESHGAGISYLHFLLISIPARAIRFVLTAVLSHTVLALLPKKVPVAYKYIILTLFWLGFYLFYFSVMGW